MRCLSTYRQFSFFDIHRLDDHQNAWVLIIMKRLEGGADTQGGEVTLLLLLPL